MSSTTQADSKRFTLKRADVFRIGQLIESNSEEVPGGRAYKLGRSDQDIAELAMQQLQLAIDAAAVARVRRQLLGPFVSDKGGIKGKLEHLQTSVAALRKQVIERGRTIDSLSKRLNVLEQPQSEPVRRPSAGNGSFRHT